MTGIELLSLDTDQFQNEYDKVDHKSLQNTNKTYLPELC
jgi:hypothetical protein